MEFWLGLSKDEIKRRLARQRWLRCGFCALGILFLAVQGMLMVQEKQAHAAKALATPPRPAAGLAAQPTATSPTRARPTATPVPPTATLPPTLTPFEAAGRTLPSPTPRGDGTPARAASLALISPPRTVSEQQFRLEGTGRPGSEVTISYERSLIARAEVDPAGRWQAEVPTAPLVRGVNRLQIAGSGSSLTLDVAFAPWWLEAPLRLQGTLGDGFACAPTVLGMAFDYYHQQDPELPAPPTTELVRALSDQGFVDGYGADAEMLVNLAIGYGYSHSYFFRNWTQAHLRRALDAGTPVVVNVRADMGTDGYGHSVLIVGLSPDGGRIMVHDPVQGMVEYAWDAFDRSWGSFGPPYHHGMVAKP